MDAFTTDILACLKQNIIGKLYDKHVTHPAVRAAVVRFFNLGPTRHANFEQFMSQTSRKREGNSSYVTALWFPGLSSGGWESANSVRFHENQP